MIEPPVTPRKIIELWKRVAPQEWFAACGADMAGDNAGRHRVWKERVTAWHRRDSIPPKYWPRLIDLVEARFGIVITPRQLMDAAAAKGDRDTHAGRSRAEAA